MNINITDPIFHDEAKAEAHIAATRWNGEPECPHCGSLKVRRMGGKTQAGMFLCNHCRDKFTVRTGSVMERECAEVFHSAYSALWQLPHATFLFTDSSLS